MPFDATEYQVETKPPITRLIEALRAPYPAWDYSMNCYCGLGLSRSRGVEPRDVILDRAAYGRFFYGHDDMRKFPGIHHSDVEQRHLVSALEHYRDTGEALSPFVFAQKERG